jgi:hypothetical protein
VTIGLVLVNSGGGTSGGGWHSFFSFLLLGMGGRRRRGAADHTLVPVALEPTPRAYPTWGTSMDTSYKWLGPRDNAPDLGSGDGNNGLGRP